MLKLNQITINNYKNLIADNLDIKNFNVIIGPNNSGKSNFLQIFSFLNHIINGSFDEIRSEFGREFFKDFGRIIPFSNANYKGTISIALKFSNTESNYQYNYQISIGWRRTEKKYLNRELYIKKEEYDFKHIHKTGPAITIFTREINNISFGQILKKQIGDFRIPESVSVINLLKVVTKEYKNEEIRNAIDSLDSIIKNETIFFSNIELTKSGKTRIDKYAGRIISFDILDEIINIYRDKKEFTFFKETLKTILKIDGVDVIKLVDSEGKDEKNAKKEYFVLFNHLGSPKTLFELSDGSILLIALITKIIISKSGILLIEEPENSLHPKALIDLINFIRSFEEDRQFIIASHSIAIINKIKAEDVIISNCNEDGSSELTRVEKFAELRRILKKGFIVFSDLLFFSPEEIL